MQQRRNDERQEERLQILRRILSEKFKSQASLIDMQEKEKISKAIQSIQFSFSVEDLLFYINKETANLLAGSSNPTLKEWGLSCVEFYTTNKDQAVDLTTGMVRSKDIYAKNTTLGGAYRHYSFSGYGYWSVKYNCWHAASPHFISDDPNYMSAFYTLMYGAGYMNGSCQPIINPNQFSLISPLHVAALIGDKDLMKNLIARGERLEEYSNKWKITPLELSIICEQYEIIDFMFHQKINKDKALKIAVEKGSFSIIEKIVNNNAPITDEILNAARTRDLSLYHYLVIKLQLDVHKQIENHGSFNALKAILNYSVIPIPSLVDLICLHPEIILTIEQEASGNTLLHQLVATKEITKVKALMEAIYDAGFKKIDGFSFDIEKKNKQGNTILDLALAQANNDVTSIILLYNPAISQAQQSLLVTAKIDIPAIHQKREARLHTIIGLQNQTLEVQQKVLENTIVEVIATKEEVAQIKDINTQLVRQLEMQHQQMQIQQQMLMQLCMAVGFEPVIPNQQVPRQPLLQYQVANQNMLFPPVQNNQNNIVLEHREVRQHEDWIEDWLRNQ